MDPALASDTGRHFINRFSNPKKEFARKQPKEGATMTHRDGQFTPQFQCPICHRHFGSAAELQLHEHICESRHADASCGAPVPCSYYSARGRLNDCI